MHGSNEPVPKPNAQLSALGWGWDEGPKHLHLLHNHPHVSVTYADLAGMF
jgi:hypothetical protein